MWPASGCGWAGLPASHIAAQFDLASAATAQADLAAYASEVGAARLAVADRSLDEQFGDETHTVDLRWLYARMIDEYGRGGRVASGCGAIVTSGERAVRGGPGASCCYPQARAAIPGGRSGWLAALPSDRAPSGLAAGVDAENH